MTAGETTLGDYIKSDLPLDEGGGGSEANLVPCSNCGRKFAEERVETHKKICTSHPERQVYDISMKRVIGTEAGELLKAGKLKLDPPKPMEKKSALHAKLNLNNENELNKTVLPPIPQRRQSAVRSARKSSKKESSGKALAYSVTFDGDDGTMKTKKNSKFKAPLTMNAPPIKSDKKFLSPESAAKTRWHKAASGVRKGGGRGRGVPPVRGGGVGSLSSHEEEWMNGEEGDVDEDDEDFLAASWASQKTVCSDAFDFLFDSNNMNPDNVKKKLIEHQVSTDTNILKDVPDGIGGGGGGGSGGGVPAKADSTVPVATTSACCVVS